MLSPLNPPILDWSKQRVWLVGASSGIGAALAKELARRGARLAVSARREAQLHHVIDQACANSPARQIDALVLPLDVTDPGALSAARDAIVAAWGGIDTVIWLAALWQPMRATDFDLAMVRKTIEINQIGALNLLAAVLPLLLKQQSGHLVLTASVAGWGGMPKAIAYGQTKAALNHLAETLWLDLHPLGIGVTVVNPGFVDTPATATNDFAMPALISADSAAQRILQGLAKGRFNVHFPLRFTRVLQFLRLLPIRVWFAVVRRTTQL